MSWPVVALKTENYCNISYSICRSLYNIFPTYYRRYSEPPAASDKCSYSVQHNDTANGTAL